MAKRKNAAAAPSTPIFPALPGEAGDTAATENSGTPAFPDMHNLNRETAEVSQHDDEAENEETGAPDGDSTREDGDEEDFDDETPRRYVCVTECFHNNELVRPGAYRNFVPGTEPEHFKPARA